MLSCLTQLVLDAAFICPRDTLRKVCPRGVDVLRVDLALPARAKSSSRALAIVETCSHSQLRSRTNVSGLADVLVNRTTIITAVAAIAKVPIPRCKISRVNILK